MNELVIDTSVLVKWFVLPRERDFPAAEALLLDHVHHRRRLHIPMLAFYEFGNVLLRAGNGLKASAPLTCLSDVYALGLSVHPLTGPRALLALELAHTLHMSFYDSCFIALAQELGIALVTADEKLRRRADALPFVHLLGALHSSS